MKKLPNAPLQEVILEVKWNIPFNSGLRAFVDPGFDVALGRFQGAVEDKFPVVIRKFPQEIPYHILGRQTVYQFWTGEKVWPVLQLGPGILSVNDTEKNYEWKAKFLPLVKSAISDLCKAYQEDLKFESFSLRYIDTVRVGDYPFADWPSFVGDHLNIKFENLFNTRGKLKRISLEQMFELESGGHLQVVVSSGMNTKKEDVLIWQIAVIENIIAEKEAMISRIVSAHEVTSSVFKEICKTSFYDSFINS